jgi:hypothetical protein
MENNPNQDIEFIEYPDEIWQEIEERDRRETQQRNEAFARELAQKTPEERAQLEQELQREREAQWAPETRTQAEIDLEEQRVLDLLDQMRTEGTD